jgi:vesicular inhibitory amino acid transporter
MQYDQETTPLLIQQDAQVIEFENPSKSTTFQTIANAINLLMGIGLLSIPYSFTKLGWTLSLVLLPLFSISTFFTATLSPNYPKNAFTKLLFSFELFMAGVAMIILFGDSTATLLGLQGYNDIIMMMSIVLLTPLTFMDLSFLARMSSIGIISIVFLVFTLFWNLLECGVELGNTRMEPRGLADVGLGIGLLFVGFDGHAVFPSLYNNIENPQKFKLAMSSTYLYVSAIYTMVGVAGYAMYGDSLFPEVRFILRRLC